MLSEWNLNLLSKTLFRRRPEYLLNFLCTFDLCPLSRRNSLCCEDKVCCWRAILVFYRFLERLQYLTPDISAFFNYFGLTTLFFTLSERSLLFKYFYIIKIKPSQGIKSSSFDKTLYNMSYSFLHQFLILFDSNGKRLLG